MIEPRPRLYRRSAAAPGGNSLEATTAGPRRPPPSSRPRRRALVAVVEATTLRSCRAVLENSGFAVEVVGTGVAAVMAAREAVPDLILMDFQLRDAPGREAIGWLRSNSALRSTPIIVLTTTAADDANLTATQPAAFLRKPVSPVGCTAPS